jgi:hypothetical protein
MTEDAVFIGTTENGANPTFQEPYFDKGRLGILQY